MRTNGCLKAVCIRDVYAYEKAWRAMDSKIDLARFENWLSLENKIGRAAWSVAHVLLFRPFGSTLLWPWRRFILRMFGAKIGPKSYIYASVRIWAPWNLELGFHSCLGPDVNVYNTGKVVVGEHVTISQGAYLCPGSHDITDPKFPMICSDMHIGDQAWIATEAFIGGKDVHVGEGAVVGARAVVSKNVDPWTVVSGNPATFVKTRVLKERS